MQNKEKCKAVLECILQIKIRDIEYPEFEKTIDKAIGSKGVRLDVYVEDDKNTIYNIEMQATNNAPLPKRMRYYQGMIDLNIIDKGEQYDKLRKSYVIFICDYDAFNLERHIYTFTNTCKEYPSLELNDETIKIILNTKGTLDDVNDDIKEFLAYMGGAEPNSELTRMLDNEVKAVKSNDKWRREYMTLYMRDKEREKVGIYAEKISVIKDNTELDINLVSQITKLSKDDIFKIKDLIKSNPAKDNIELSEMYIVMKCQEETNARLNA